MISTLSSLWWELIRWLEYKILLLLYCENKDDNVYDVVIDPGHGGLDGGASKNGYKETLSGSIHGYV